jgi:hypothetical protein
MVFLIIGSAIAINQTKYTNLIKVYSNQLNESSVVESISITVQEPTEYVPKNVRSVTIQNKEVIEKILEEFSSVELKEENIQHLYRSYYIVIVVTNQIEKGHFSTTSIHLNIDKNYMNNYKIISKTNHLKTIKSLVEDDSVAWQEHEHE